jgi:hypothetical protein
MNSVTSKNSVCNLVKGIKYGSRICASHLERKPASADNEKRRGTMQRIFRLLLVASAIAIGGFWFVHWSNTRALNSGAVHVRQQPAESAKSATPQNDVTQPDTATQPSQPQEVASNAGEQPRGPETVTTLPASRTISRNPPSGIVAAGSGKFELYRQGDLTFRLNTETGDACVLFATQSEWSKNIVYDHGCNSHR